MRYTSGLVRTCPYCDDELTGRCDCGSPACVCGFCPQCESETERDDTEEGDLEPEDA